MIELETATTAALLLLADMVCSGIAAWRGTPNSASFPGALPWLSAQCSCT